MRYCDLFAGIGGFRLGIERIATQVSFPQERQTEVGNTRVRHSKDNSDSRNSGQPQTTCVYTNEWDKYVAQIYEKNFGGKVDTRSITDVSADEIPGHDFLCGGFPCQAFSVAGKRKGFEDTRGTLFFDIARILKTKRPAYLLLENVKGLLSHDNGRTFETILRTLDELGYDLQWQVLNSKDFGVPQNRERVFIIGHSRKERRPEVFPIRGGYETDNDQITSTAIDTNYWKGVDNHGQRTMIEITKNVSDAERIYDSVGLAKTLKGLGGGLGAKTGLYATRQPLKFLERNQRNIAGDYAFTVDGANTGGLKVGTQIRRLTPVECARLQGFPDHWCEGISDTQAYKCYGNAVSVPVVEAIIERMFP